MEWLEDLAAALGVEAAGPDEVADVLDAARDVAHRVERKITPVSTFLLGLSVQQRIHDGSPRPEAMASALQDLRRTLPG
jgi:hypothetical protein